MRVGNKGGKPRRKKRAARVIAALRHIDDRKRRSGGWAGRQASRIANRRSYQGSVLGSIYRGGKG